MASRWTNMVLGAGCLLLVATMAGAQADTSLDTGVRLFRAQNFAGAKSHLTIAIQANPNSAVAAFHLGRIAIAHENAQEAVKWLEKAVALEPRNASYRLWLGQAYGAQALRASRMKQAFIAKKVQRAFEDAVRLDPSSVEARLALIRYYLVAPGFMGGSRSKAEANAKEISKLNPYQGRIAMAALAEAAKDYERADRELNLAVQTFPDSASAYYVLGGVYQRTRQWDKAFAIYERLLARLPNETNALYFIGRLGALSGQREDRAEEALRRFVTIPPREGSASVASAYLRLGSIQAKHGQRDAARESYTAGLKVDPRRNDLKEALKTVR